MHFPQNAYILPALYFPCISYIYHQDEWGLWVRNETPLEGQVVLAEMNVIWWGNNECDGI